MSKSNPPSASELAEELRWKVQALLTSLETGELSADHPEIKKLKALAANWYWLDDNAKRQQKAAESRDKALSQLQILKVGLRAGTIDYYHPTIRRIDTLIKELLAFYRERRP